MPSSLGGYTMDKAIDFLLHQAGFDGFLRPVGPRKAENSEVDQLVQRVCTGLDGTDIGAGRCWQALPVEAEMG